MRTKHSLTHLLGADTDLKVIKAYGLWQQKKLWGHEYLGVVRTSVVVDAAQGCGDHPRQTDQGACAEGPGGDQGSGWLEGAVGLINLNGS